MKVRVDEELASTRAHRDATIEEKRALKTRFDEIKKVVDDLGGQEGIERLSKLREALAKDELGKLLAEGKHDEWFDKKSKAQRADHANQLKVLREELDGIKSERDTTTLALKRKNLETEVLAACGAHKVLDDARSDVMLNADAMFTQDPEHKGMVIKDEDGGVVFGKDGKSPKTIVEWLEEHKDSGRKRHWFGASKGAGADGNLQGGERTEDDLGEVTSVKDWREKRKKLNMGSGFGTDNI